ncbi:MAG: aminotransferase class III-fold pyridoxal phosphate-dependent enzyme, partial [Victivallales bacterium]|nr:aminotransferase class III-fold pyridoxal phosphate-dependent enzyme [Victivallales bacterium]
DMQGFSFAILNDLDSVKKLITNKTVAVMLEPVQGEGGVLPVTRDFICGVRKLCDENNLLLLLDEVQCGMARTGTYFAYERFGVKPDAMTIAKPSRTVCRWASSKSARSMVMCCSRATMARRLAAIR